MPSSTNCRRRSSSSSDETLQSVVAHRVVMTWPSSPGVIWTGQVLVISNTALSAPAFCIWALAVLSYDNDARAAQHPPTKAASHAPTTSAPKYSGDDGSISGSGSKMWRRNALLKSVSGELSPPSTNAAKIASLANAAFARAVAQVACTARASPRSSMVKQGNIPPCTSRSIDGGDAHAARLSSASATTPNTLSSAGSSSSTGGPVKPPRNFARSRFT
mmetsp:Transcript_5849/g.16487  ORF Transcript_5849/g.16487 Transcript_5849/m.16487 type:complete len:218 (-) Transcript_5849:2169-2822(-)